MSKAPLTDKQIEKILPRFHKAKEVWQKMQVLREAVPSGNRYELLWHLVRTGAIDGPASPALWSELDDGDSFASSEDVFALVSNIKPAALKKCSSVDFVKGWPVVIDQLVAAAYDKDPSPWERGRNRLPEAFREGFAFLRVRLGQKPSPKEAKHLLRVIADATVAGGYAGLNKEFWCRRNGEREFIDIYTDNRPNEDFAYFIGLFGTKDEWLRTYLEAWLANPDGFDLDRHGELVPIADRAQAVTMLAHFVSLGANRSHWNDVYRFLGELRHDSPSDLLWMANALTKDHARSSIAEACAVVALQRLAAQGKKPDPRAVDFIRFGAYDTTPGPNVLHGVDMLVAALRTLPEDTRRTLIRAGFEYRLSIPTLEALPEPALLEEALARMNAVEGKTFDAMWGPAFGLGRLGAAQLPWLTARAGEATNPLVRDALVLAVLLVLRGVVRAGGSLDPAWDRWITFHGWDADGEDDDYDHYVRPVVLELVKALPPSRAEAVLVREIDPKKRSFTRPFEALAFHPTPASLEHAFNVLASARAKISQTRDDYVALAVKALGERAFPYVQRALAAADDKLLVKHFEAALGNELLTKLARSAGTRGEAESPAETIARLSKEIAGPRTRIYVLTPREEPPAEGAVSRVDGKPVGVPDDKWPRKKKSKFDHLFTLDLRAMPELPRPSDAVALALFIHARTNNRASKPGSKDVALLWLNEADFALGVVPSDDEYGEAYEARALDIVPIEVPAAALASADAPPGVDAARFSELRKAVYRLSARAGGAPIWLQDEAPTEGKFLLQFDAAFTDVNLGDSGVMYVFEDTAFWQCH